MRAIGALAITITLLVGGPAAHAQKIDLSRTTCKELLESGKEGLIIIWSWLYGYYADQDADPVIDFDKLTAQGQRLAGYCKDHPNTDVISAAEPIYDK
jgi:acid stress chaperone HdeB